MLNGILNVVGALGWLNVVNVNDVFFILIYRFTSTFLYLYTYIRNKCKINSINVTYSLAQTQCSLKCLPGRSDASSRTKCLLGKTGALLLQRMLGSLDTGVPCKPRSTLHIRLHKRIFACTKVNVSDLFLNVN